MPHLRDVLESDLPVFFAHQREPEAVAMAAFPPRDHAAFFAHWRDKVLGDPRTRNQTVVSDDGEVAGYVASWPDGERRLVGYWIGRAFWGRGVATAALAAFLRHDPTRPLHAWVAVNNLASVRVLARCGFVRAGVPHTGDDGVSEALYQLGP